MSTNFVDLVKSLGLAAGDFDFVIVADGSGTKADTPGGFYATLYDVNWEIVEKLGGSLSHCTNNLAELLPFLLGCWRIEGLLQARKNSLRPRILCVSDSEVTVRGANGTYGRNANLAFWAALEHYEKLGFRFEWRHIPRNSHALHSTADKASRELRLSMEAFLEQ